jgi:hypothetical protein
MQPDQTSRASGAPEFSEAAWGVEKLDPLADAAWDRAVAEHPEATVFHTSAWARVLVSTYGHRPKYLRFSHADGSRMLVPIMEVRSWVTGSRGVCMPFSDECGPLVKGRKDFGVVADFLTKTARASGWKHCEVRGGSGETDGPGETEPEYVAHTLNLKQPETTIFGGIHNAARRAIRKAERSGMTVEIERGVAALRAFYKLHVRTRRKHGLPPQPWAFFENLQREVIEQEAGFVVVAEMKGQPIAASVFLQLGGQAIYKFGASDETQQEFRGANLVMWKGIRHLHQTGARTLEFGRTSSGNGGLRRFKLSWGAVERPLRYWRRRTKDGGSGPGSDRTTGAHTQFFRRSPLWVNRIVGSLLYRHLD